MPYKDPEAQREYQRRWMLERRLSWLQGKVCIDCGEDSVKLLEIDHVDATTKITHRIWSWSAVRREAELAKCVVRCIDCHDKKTVRSEEYESKLTSTQVAEIRRLALEGIFTQKEIGDRFGVDFRTVSSIKLNRTWKHVD